MTAPRSLAFRRRFLVRLLSGSAFAAALCVFPGAAGAQGFQGNHSVVTGGAGITTAPDYTAIEIVAPETVIEWTPFDVSGAGTIDFLPNGATAEFAELTGTLDYTVLNRIIPLDGGGNPAARAVAFNGTVVSQIGNFAGGNIWFYSPTGIIAGPTAQFNVGSLILTTNDIVFGTGNTGGTELFGPGGVVQFRGPADSAGFVEVQAGADITATGSAFGPAYIAFAAPRVVQAGQVSADGPIAYAAAEQLDLTINAGLFDFTVLVGTTDADGIVHTGTTTGPASTGVADAQRIAMVALPKNDALTMLLSGSIGYTPAASAFDDGSSIVLSAGFDSASPDADPGNRLANISIGNATFRNVLAGYASGAVAIAPVGGSATFENIATFDALRDIGVIAESGETVTGAVDLVLRAGEPGTGGNVLVEARDTGAIGIAGLLNAAARSTAFYAPAAGDAAGGTVAISADGGTIDMLQSFVEASAESALGGEATGGTIDVSALNGGAITATNFLSLNVSASAGSTGTQGGEAIGGSASLTASSGTIAVGNAFLDAAGFGGFGGTLAGDGAGGTVEASVLGGGSLTAEFLSLDGRGFGGVSDAQGGNGTGGEVSLSDLGGLLDLGIVVLSAGAAGGNGGTNAGDGVGGTALVAIASQAQSWDALIADAGATAGGPADGGGLTGNATAQADAVTLSITGPGSLSLASDLELIANASMNVNGQPGFTGQAGGVAIDVGPGGALTVDGTILAHASAFVEDEGGFPSNWDSSPTQQGGTVSLTADGGTITAFELEARAEAYGLYAATAAGTATGGSVTAFAVDGGVIRIDNGSGGALARLSADGLGAIGPAASDAIGGTARLIAEDGSISVAGDILISASGRIAEFFDPLPSGEGFSATGGEAGVELRAGTNGTAFIAGDDLEVVAVGDNRQILSVGTLVPGEVPIEGDSGSATGGAVSLTMMAGDLAFDDVLLDSSGIGGTSAATDGGVAFRSGDGFAGSSLLTVDGGGAALTGSLEIASNGQGGGGGAAATGVQLAALAGNGTGGGATLRLNGGTLTVQGVELEATGVGGAGMDHSGTGNATDGGTGLGGTAALIAPSGWAGSFSSQTLHTEANGDGGDGGVAAGGADGQGGGGAGFAAAVDLADGAFSLGEATIEATGTGGDGALGGQGAGGRARFVLADSATGPTAERTIDELFIDASGFGGIGSAGPIAASDAGDAGLTVAVLDPDAALALRGDLSIFGLGSLASPAVGIDALVSGASLDVGGNIVMSTSGDIAIAAGQPLHSVGDMALSGRAIASTGLLDADGALSVEGVAGIDADRLASGGTTLLRVSNGPLVVANDLASAGAVTALARAIDITALGGLSFADATATAGDVVIVAAGDLTIADTDASNALDLESGGRFSLTGAARGGSIAVVSADVAVGADAQLGIRGLTGAILLTNGDASSDTFIGGAAQAGGYSLDAAETARLFADESITLLADGNVTVGDLALSYGGGENIGGGGALEISTPAAVSIVGHVVLTTSGADDTFLIDPTLIELDSDSGSIAMLDDGGNPLGRLSMVGDRIAIADTDTLGLLRTETDFAAINAALDLPGGSAEPVRAGAIVFDVTDGLFIQNGGASDAYADRRGFAVSSVEIVTADPSNRIAVNGQILTAGGPVGGLDTESLVIVNGEPAAAGGRFDPASTINGCVIGTDCRFVPPGLPTEDPPTSIDLERPGLVGEPAGSQFAAPLIELADTEPLITPPLVDEPITGVGNDDLWVSPCDPNDESCEGADAQQ